MTSAPRIALVGSDVPRQIIRALGAVPHRVFGSWRTTPSAEALSLLGAVDAAEANVLDRLLDAPPGEAAGVVVCNDSVVHLRMFYVLRMLHRSGRFTTPVHLLDAPTGDGAARVRFVAEQYRSLAEFVSKAVGRRLDAAGLAEAGERERALGAALDRLSVERAEGRVSGSAVLLARQRAAQDAVPTPEIRPPAGAEGMAGVFITGSAHPDDSVYRIVEQQGLRIVGDDHPDGDLLWFGAAVGAGTVDQMLEDLAVQHGRRAPRSARSGARERAHELRRRVEQSRADLVLSLVRAHDDGPLWDIASQRGALGGVPLVAKTAIGPGDAHQAMLAGLNESVRRS